MGRCPKCGAEIDHLWFKENRASWYLFRVIDGESNYEYDEDEEAVPYGFYCPNCWELVCEDEEDAVEILERESNSPRAWEI